MALTISPDCGNYGAMFTPKAYGKSVPRILTGKIDFDDSYPTNGESMNLDAYFDVLLGVIFESKAGYVFEYDYTAKKVKVMRADYDAAADGPLVEVGNGTNLGTITGVRFIAWGC